MSTDDARFRKLPAVSALVIRPEIARAIETRGRDAVLGALRATLDGARNRLRTDEAFSVDPDRLVVEALATLNSRRSGLRSVINATGILLNTGLGRSPLAEEALEAIAAVARGYCNLEFDLERGERGHRTSTVSERLRTLVGAEAATVVNNNAAATVIALRAVAKDREVVVSRGQLVEIGGSFRLPEIFEVSGARLCEVGTTNKTRLSDYERAIGPETAALMRVHPSNYRIEGFVESVEIAELARLAHARGLAAIDDVGSGALDRERTPESRDEPTVAEGLAAGADLVLFSGDKLLGGPQCGIIVGAGPWVAKVERDPLMRAFRVDKLTLAALEATLILAADPELGRRRIPLWRFLTTPTSALEERAKRLANAIREQSSIEASAVSSSAMIGGGSHPVEALSSYAVELPFRSGGESNFARRLRTGPISVVGRILKGSLRLDLRAVAETEDDRLARAIHDAQVATSASAPGL